MPRRAKPQPPAKPLRAVEVAEQVWQMREAGATYRQIASTLHIAQREVSAVLFSDPARLEVIRADRRDEAISQWMAIHRAALDHEKRLLDAAVGGLFDDDGNMIPETFWNQAARWASIARQAANDAARHLALAAGEPTERIATIADPSPADDVARRRERLIDEAIERGWVEHLSPEFQLAAHRRMRALDRGGAAG